MNKKKKKKKRKRNKNKNRIEALKIEDKLEVIN